MARLTPSELNARRAAPQDSPSHLDAQASKPQMVMMSASLAANTDSTLAVYLSVNS